MDRSRILVRIAIASAVAFLAVACGDDGESGDSDADAPAPGDLGVDVATLQPTVDHPLVAFSSVRRAVYEGEEVEDGETLEIRTEATVRDTTLTVAGVEVTVVDVLDYEDGELVEETEDYYAQDQDGNVWYLGEAVDEFEDGELVGHGGEWLAGEDGNLAGQFMLADPQVGDVFEQERAPGVAEDRSTVIALDVAVTVPAGSFEGCMETEDLDPIDDVTETKFYCPDVGLVQEVFPEGGSLDLVEFERG